MKRCSSLGVEDDQLGESLDLEVLGCRLHPGILEGQSQPWLLREVLVIQGLVLIT